MPETEELNAASVSVEMTIVFSINLFVSCVTVLSRGSLSSSSQEKPSLFIMYCLFFFLENILLDLISVSLI